MKTMSSGTASLLSLTLFVATSALAHHSHTRFDLDRVVAFEGTVVLYEWKNPQVYLTVADEAGDEWLIETDPTPVMSRSGWTSESFAPGDVVAVRANPDRRPDVAHGLLVAIEGSDASRWRRGTRRLRIPTTGASPGQRTSTVYGRASVPH